MLLKLTKGERESYEKKLLAEKSHKSSCVFATKCLLEIARRKDHELENFLEECWDSKATVSDSILIVNKQQIGK